jgi:hypothetical protein
MCVWMNAAQLHHTRRRKTPPANDAKQGWKKNKKETTSRAHSMPRRTCAHSATPSRRAPGVCAMPLSAVLCCGAGGGGGGQAPAGAAYVVARQACHGHHQPPPQTPPINTPLCAWLRCQHQHAVLTKERATMCVCKLRVRVRACVCDVCVWKRFCRCRLLLLLLLLRTTHTSRCVAARVCLLLCCRWHAGTHCRRCCCLCCVVGVLPVSVRTVAPTPTQLHVNRQPASWSARHHHHSQPPRVNQPCPSRPA